MASAGEETLVRPVGEKTNKQTSREDGWGGEHITFFWRGGLCPCLYVVLKGLLECRCIASVSCNIWKSRNWIMYNISDQYYQWFIYFKKEKIIILLNSSTPVGNITQILDTRSKFKNIYFFPVVIRRKDLKKKILTRRAF